MKKDKDVLKTVNKIYYRVNLTYGQVTNHLSDYPVAEGPYKDCRNLQEADLYSLNVLRQNVNETKIKTGSKPDSVSREFLGQSQIVETKQIKPTMDWLRETFPEKFI